MGSPKHYRFDRALKADQEEKVPVSILRLRPFYYVFDHTMKGSDKVYRKDDPRLRSGTKNSIEGIPDRKRWWEAMTLWTDVDFGAGPGGIAVREKEKEVLVLGIGGGVSF